VVVFIEAAAMSVISVIASLTAGGRYIQVEKEPVRGEVPQGASRS